MAPCWYCTFIHACTFHAKAGPTQHWHGLNSGSVGILHGFVWRWVALSGPPFKLNIYRLLLCVYVATLAARVLLTGAKRVNSKSISRACLCRSMEECDWLKGERVVTTLCWVWSISQILGSFICLMSQSIQIMIYFKISFLFLQYSTLPSVFLIEDENSDSEEGGKKKFSSRSAKPQSPALPPRNPAHVIQSPAHVPQSPALPPQPIVPQPKALVRNRTSKRRSRTNRRQI